MKNSITLGRIGGIVVGVHYSWLWIAALVVWSLAGRYFPERHPGWETGTYWLTGAIAMLALFASVLVHELGHSLAAGLRGISVRSITLFLFGGVAHIEEDAETAGDEFAIAIAGPLTSFALAGVLWLAHRAVAPAQPADPTIGGIVAAILGYLATVNVLLGVFNLLPGFPLDGGRVFRALVWSVTGNPLRATRIASYTGQGLGLLLIFLGISLVLGGIILSGIWIAIIGWFLRSAAGAEHQGKEVTEQLRGVQVAQIMDTTPVAASPDLKVQDFIVRHALQQGNRALPVTDGGRLIGIVSVTDAKEVPPEDWPSTSVAEIMTPAPLKTIAPEAPVGTALQLLVEEAYNQLPVVKEMRLVGLLTREHILRFLHLRRTMELDIASHQEPVKSRGAAA
jgi:Zn-dependent protease